MNIIFKFEKKRDMKSIAKRIMNIDEYYETK